MVKDRADEKLNTISSTASPETQRKLGGVMSKIKEGAEKTKFEVEKAKKEIEKRAGKKYQITRLKSLSFPQDAKNMISYGGSGARDTAAMLGQQRIN